MKLFRANLSGKVAILVVVSLILAALASWLSASTALEREARSRAAERQEANMRVAWDILHQYGKELRVQDGVLWADQTRLNGLIDPVDRIKQLVGGTATLFMGDTRVTTNVVKADGTRAVGTKLAKGPVYDAVLGNGKAFRGEAEILGVSYFTAYDPLRDAAGKVIGVLYVGIPKDVFMSSTSQIETSLLLLSGLVTIVLGGATYLIGRRLFSPLNRIVGAMGALAAGDPSVPMPWASRSDDIGAMARAMLGFQQAAVEKVQLARQATEARTAVEHARQQAEALRAEEVRWQKEATEAIATGLAQLSKGNLAFRLTNPFHATYEALRSDFNAAGAKLQQALSAVAADSGAILEVTDEISSSADDLARRTEAQSESLETTTRSVQEIFATVRKTSEGASHAREIVAKAKASAESSGEVVRQAVEAMSGIEQSARQIDQIIGVINDIAFQTNLLALNAGVEAARAGEAGRGFAVVASEVRALAQRSADAAKQIKTLIAASSHRVDQGVELVGETGRVLERIIEQVADINTTVIDIAASAKDQAEGLDRVVATIAQMEKITRQNADMVDKSAAASHGLQSLSESLASSVARFTLDHRQAEVARPALRKAA
ncbi:methyl-accepting chemotaxis protein [Lichenifustis flavocetrariae]|uniref:Methyl-accepting chemotaxis protein n=1 Tax=Lichenifustis flavocetrariae TaxID=2949735 RepID=A0AA41YSR1_9HYPH|nr:methyl-accepting chemotaxis protein [Lichenifustis flavocetrariae]MCW6506630.1 methyl-accepting chemotaxis protein [Lichenifustis flavocetrariae]